MRRTRFVCLCLAVLAVALAAAGCGGAAAVTGPEGRQRSVPRRICAATSK